MNSKYIDADAFVRYLSSLRENYEVFNFSVSEIEQLLNNFQGIQITTCENCKYHKPTYYDTDSGIEKGYLCTYSAFVSRPVCKDDFCSHGTPRN